MWRFYNLHFLLCSHWAIEIHTLSLLQPLLGDTLLSAYHIWNALHVIKSLVILCQTLIGKEEVAKGIKQSALLITAPNPLTSQRLWSWDQGKGQREEVVFDGIVPEELMDSKRVWVWRFWRLTILWTSLLIMHLNPQDLQPGDSVQLTAGCSGPARGWIN